MSKSENLEREYEEYRKALLASTGKAQPSWAEELLVDAYLGHSFNENGEKSIEDGEIIEATAESVNYAKSLQCWFKEKQHPHSIPYDVKMEEFSASGTFSSYIPEQQQSQEPYPPGTEEFDTEVDSSRGQLLMYEACQMMRNGPDDPLSLKEILDEASLACCFDINTSWPSLGGRTLLMEAAKKGWSRCVELLLTQFDATPNFQTKEGKFSALQLACFNGHVDAVHILLSSGAVPCLPAKLENKGRKRKNSALAKQCTEIVTDFINLKWKGTATQRMHQGRSLGIDITAENSKYVHISRPWNRKSFEIGLRKFQPNEEMPPEQNTATALFLLREWQEQLTSYISSEKDGISSAIVSVLQEKTRNKCSAANLCFEYEENVIRLQPTDNFSLKLGRSRANDVILSEERASKVHASIYFSTDMGFVLEDLGSRHGTFVNDERLDPHTKHIIWEGDKISFGGPKIEIKRYVSPVIAERDFSVNPTLFDALEKKAGLKEYCRWQQTKRLKQLLVGEKQDKKKTPASGYNYRDRAEDRRRLHTSLYGKDDIDINEHNLLDDHTDTSFQTDGKTVDVQNKHAQPRSSDAPIFGPGLDLLTKMGWTSGEGLGKEKQGKTGVVLMQCTPGKTGVGFTTQFQNKYNRTAALKLK